jgi:hypothetical protein
MRPSTITHALSRHRLAALVIVLVAVLTGFGVGVLLGDRGSTALAPSDELTPSPTQTAVPSQTVDPTPEPSSPMPEASPGATSLPTPLPTTTAEPSGRGSAMVDEVVAVVTNDLVVRSRPGTGSDSQIYSARLSAPATVFVIAGPEASDGFEWYLVDPVGLPCHLGCDDVPRAGWVAAASKEGERWLAEEPERSTCSDDPTLDGLLTIPPQMWLHCYPGRDLILNGTIADASTTSTSGWPWEWRNWLYPAGWSPPAPGCVDWCAGPSLTLAHDSEVGVPSLPGATRVIGHFDDQAAARCRSEFSDVEQRLAVYECRKVFVVTSGW